MPSEGLCVHMRDWGFRLEGCLGVRESSRFMLRFQGQCIFAVRKGTGQGQELDMIDVNSPYHFKATQGIRAFPDAALRI